MDPEQTELDIANDPDRPHFYAVVRTAPGSEAWVHVYHPFATIKQRQRLEERFAEPAWMLSTSDDMPDLDELWNGARQVVDKTDEVMGYDALLETLKYRHGEITSAT